MPNFYYQTDFGEYQWKKHGSCQVRNDDDYFLLATSLVQQVDSSAIGQYIKHNIGKQITVTQFKQALIKQIGAQATSRVQLNCLKGRYLNELRINLAKDFEKYESLPDMLASGPTAESFAGNCPTVIAIED